MYDIRNESESEMFLFDPYQKYIQSNNGMILDQGTPIALFAITPLY